MGGVFGRPRRKRAEGKVVLVTGCSQGGIGYAIAEEFGKRGAVVFATARRLDAMDGLQEQGVRTLQLDVTKEEEIQAAVSVIMEEAGRIDVLVNNAAIMDTRPVADTSSDGWERIFRTNLFGGMAVARAVFAHMAEHGDGLIVNLSSCAGYCPSPMVGAYSASKAALNAATDCMRMEMKPFGVKVMLLVPGFVRTNIFRSCEKHRADLPVNSLYKSCESALHPAEWASKLNMTSTEELAFHSVNAMLHEPPPTRFFYGAGWKQAMFGVWFLPTWIIDLKMSEPYQNALSGP
eukprot:TRINITY_DN15735_c0_g1_i1.p1 TRINITY_DN15735_c0_g1~~TRINITY_DN15735_c0_g1_i1.p1  ORF type:complete len:291 (-),score=23.17 TRINITY_DN15735_c0_g1_i1:55-927(-)